MKSLYLFFAGIGLLASGTHFIHDFPDNRLPETKPVTEKAKEPAAVKTEKIPFSPLQVRKENHRQALIPGITATNTYVLTNDTGLSGPSAGDELEYTVTITNNGTAATDVVFTDQIDIHTTLVPGSVKVSPVAQDDAYSTIGNVGLAIPAGSGVLSNDVSPSGAALTIAGPAIITTAHGGTVTMDLATGAFTYVPAAGFIGADTFTYTLENGSGLPSSGTVTITATGAIWFINAAASADGANGTLARPFNSLADFQAINDGGTLRPQPGHSIFIYSGSYTGPVTLLSQQKLIGQGATPSLLTVAGLPAPSGTNLLPATAGGRPLLTSSGAVNVINVNANNTLRGLNVGNTAQAKIAGSTAGTLTVNEVGLSGGGCALNVSNVTFAAEFSEVSSSVSSGTSPIKISNSNGSLKIDAGTLSASGVAAIDISGTSLALNVTLNAVSCSNAAKGLIVSGTTGTFQVTGSGTIAGSGGTIQNITARGVELLNTAGITLRNMNLASANTAEGSIPVALDNTNANAAVHANAVAGLTLDRVVISGTVVQEGVNLRNVSNFNFTNGAIGTSGTFGQSEEGCIYAINTSGTNTITNSTLNDPGGRVAYFSNTNTNMTQLTVTNSIFSNAGNGPGIQFEGRGTSNMKLKIEGASQFLNCRTSGVEVYANNSSVIHADIRNSTINVGGGVGTGIDIAASGAATVLFNVLNNISNYNNGPCLNFFAIDNGYVEGNVIGNTLTKTAGGGSGIRFYAEGATARGVLKIESNTINNQFDGSGLNLSAISTTGARSDFTINSNIINLANNGSLYGIDMNTISSIPGNSAKMCGNLTNNSIGVVSSTLNGARIRSGLATTEILLQGTGGTVQDVWNNGSNTPVNRATQSGPGPFTFGQTCAVPNVPALARMGIDELAGGRIGADEDSENLQEAETVIVQESEPVSTGELPAAIPDAARQGAARQGTALAGETVTVNGTGSGFTIPDGKEVVIKFRVTINEDIPTAVCEISNQGVIAGSNFSTVLTDDPNVAGTDNPTVTAVSSVPVITFCPENVVVDPDAGTCTSTQTLAAVAEGCPAPAVTYAVEGNPITFPYVFPAGTTTVAVTASNGIGTAPTCSFTVTVTPMAAPVISQNPDPQIICAGGDATFSVQTSAADVTYQWQKKPSGGVFAAITAGENPTAATATLSLTNVPLSDNDAEYQCVVSNPCAGSTSIPALLTVNQVTGSGVTGTTVVNQGEAAPAVTFEAAGGTLPYTFSYKVNDGSPLTVTTTGAGTTGTVSQPTDIVGIFTYELISVSDAQGCLLIPPVAQTATIEVASDLTAIISGAADVCQHAAPPEVTFEAIGGLAPFTFTYTINGGGGQQISTTGSDRTVSVPVPTDAAGTFTYELVSVSGAGEASTVITGESVSVAVGEMPVIALTGDEYECSSGLDVYTVFFTASAGAVVTSDKGTVVGNTVTDIPTNETAILTATIGECSATLPVFINCALPVTLIDFSAAKQESAVRLQWKTSEETNSEKFEVERSTDAKSWQTIGDRKAGGESAAVRTYSFIDTEPAAGSNYYRLKMVDVDRTYAYSPIVTVRFSTPLASESYPNPVSDLLYLKSSDWNQVVAVELYDIRGRTVYQSGNHLNRTIPVKTLPAGTYLLAIIHKNGTVTNQKVVINR